MRFDITTKEKLIEVRSSFAAFSFDDATTMKGFHITTSANQCKDILSRGLESLPDVLKNSNSEMSQFLHNYGLSFDIDKSVVIRKGRSYSLEMYPYKQILPLLRRKVYAFLYCEDVKSYGVVHRYPEILNEMVKNAILPSGALKGWEENSKAYKISFAIPVSYASQTYLQVYKLGLKDYLLEQMEKFDKFSTLNIEIGFDQIPSQFITDVDLVV